ncbi:MAG: DUF1816 domain-containing protein [Prochloraceae cyanobacterium]
MSILQILMFFISDILKRKSQKWWIEVKTTTPQCVYYFGPFNNYKEAESHQAGYIEDLLEEKAINITAKIKKCQPNNLTIEVI